MTPDISEYDLLVIGGGPAGLAAVSYALHAQLNVALAAPDLGGKVSYPFALRDMPTRDTVWGASLVHEFEELVRAGLRHHLQAEVKALQRTEDDGFAVTLADGATARARAVIVATGARAQRLYVAGESEYWGKGVSFSAISHAPLFQGKSVAVIGSGTRAINAVLAMAQLARQVYLVVGSRVQLASSRASQLALRLPNVLDFRDWEVQQIVGDQYVTGLDLVGSNGEIRTLDVEGVFVQFGLLPNNAILRGVAELDHEGHVIIDATCTTSVPGLFAAGDVSSVHAEQVPVSMGEGAKAALTAWEYLAARAG